MEGKHISEASKEALQLIEDRKTGIIKPLATPWPKLNKCLLGGIEMGCMFTLAGMSSSGKTAFASQLYRELHENNPTQDFIILFFSFEMPAAKLMIRDAIANTQIYREIMLSANGNQINISQEEAIKAYYKSVENKPIYFIERPKSSEEYIKICREWHEKTGKKIVALSDHSLLFKGSGTGDREMLVDLSKDIMIQKNEGWCTHILLTQLNREIESAARRMPKSPLNYPDQSCLSSSSSIFQASDYVVIVHRPYLLKFVGDTYGPDGLSTDIKSLYYHVIKNREGETSILTMTASFKTMQIIDA